MKRLFHKPGFEFIFSLSLIAIMCLPPLVFGQGVTKDLEIKIENRDTTINGKNIKDLSPAERATAMKDIKNLTGHHEFVFKGRGDQFTVTPDSNNRRFFMERRFRVKRDTAFADGHRFNHDAPFVERDDRSRDFILHDSAFFDHRFNDDRPRDNQFSIGMRPGWGGRPPFFRGANSQQFHFSTTGSDGSLTEVNFSVSDTREERMENRKDKRDGKPSAELELTDLNIIPQFSSGKTLLMFNLPAKAVATVQYTDGNDQVLWSAKTLGGEFSKSFPLGLNGTYFLKVKQGNKEVTKRIVKQ